MTTKLEQLQAEIAMEELHEGFLAAKATFEASDKAPEDYDAYRAVKLEFSAARTAYREAREAVARDQLAAQTGEPSGDATVTPETVRASASVTDQGRAQ